MSDNFPILAVETSGDLCSAAVMLDEKVFFESTVKRKNIHSEILFSLIENIFKEASIGISDIGQIAISAGPGSFTGLRIGMSAVKGIALGASLPIIPVPTFEALAMSICNYIREGTKFIIANTVNREQLYYSKFIKEKNQYKILKSISVLNKSEFGNYLEDDNLIFGNYYSTDNIVNVSSPTADQIGRWSYIYGKDLLTFDYDYLEPNYLKNFIAKVKK